MGIDASTRQRGSSWYAVWVAVMLTLAAMAFLIHWFLGYWQFWTVLGLGVIIFATLLIINNSSREVNYELTKKHISINNKPYPLSDFRAFSVSNLEGTWILSLIPAKKLSMAFDIIIPADQGERIVNVFGKLLPMETPSNTIAERLASVLKL